MAASVWFRVHLWLEHGRGGCGGWPHAEAQRAQRGKLKVACAVHRRPCMSIEARPEAQGANSARLSVFAVRPQTGSNSATASSGTSTRMLSPAFTVPPRSTMPITPVFRSSLPSGSSSSVAFISPSWMPSSW